MNDKHPPADPHLPAREIFPGVWLAQSQVAMKIPLGLKVKFSRNMQAVLQPEGWVLLNPVRLSDAEEKKLTDKAPIKNVVRLGTFHHRDDAYYVDKFGATFWAVPGPQAAEAPPIAREITEDGPFPIAGAKVVIFRNASQAECVVYLPEHRLLVTCDSVQHYEKDDPLINFLGRRMMPRLGFFTPCVIGPFWLKGVVPEGGSLKPDFERIMALDFDNLVAAHGAPKIGGAKQALAANVAKLP